MKKLIDRALRTGEKGRLRTYEKRVEEINRFEAEMELLGDEEFPGEVDALRQRLGAESLDDILPETFALVREAARRTLGQRHYDVQLVGGMILHDGAIAEMKTGEGKTLTATLAVSLQALSGQGVHVVTVNDYLARRDALWMKPIYDLLGISVGAIQEGDSPEVRRELYNRDVTYGTNSEFGFDYLRDNMAQRPEDRVQRGHHFVLIDEVDNILIDEARTPLIISGAPEEAASTYQTFARLARQLRGVPHQAKLRSEGETRDTSDADYDYEYDEKHKTVAPTERGVERAEKFLGVDHLFQAERGPLVNHLQQALKAESLYRRDRDYAVVDGQVHIVDEFTGRILEGRRWSEGLHQAIEAKEGVRVREENQTMASITLQNYFRLYKKLSGMTGTALTEANEFMKIYKVHVVPVPTHMPVEREDLEDLVYKTESGKWAAVADEITSRNENGQPVLVGTVSVEKSEALSEVLKARGIKHSVLNAKPENAEREGEIVAQAGRLGSVTIATNMAGRGVDIKLGGDPEEMARALLRKKRVDATRYREELQAETERLQPLCQEEGEAVRERGGLFILGTERHESRRIDNQLRGRSGRQGDPGASRFFLSGEDEVVRLFAGDRIYNLIDKLGPVDSEGREVPLESKLLTRTIENAQKKVEEQNFLLRKRVLEYDDVLNEQRRVIYLYRDDILDGRDLQDLVLAESERVIRGLVEEYTPGDTVEDWDLQALEDELRQIWPLGIELPDPYALERAELGRDLFEDFQAAYSEREKAIGTEEMRQIERVLLLHVLDDRWREHLYDMDYLREGIHLRGFAQIDPLVAYKNEGYTMFEEFLRSLWHEFDRLLLRVEPVASEPSHAQSEAAPEEVPSAISAKAPAEGERKLGRNEPCWCGSGRKFKKCHGA